MAIRKPSGAGAAALVAAGLGAFTIGLMTTLAVISSRLNTALIWYAPSGPLSGKTGAGVIVWLVAWIVLHNLWKKHDVNLDRAARWAFLLVALGFVLTFPPVFEALER